MQFLRNLVALSAHTCHYFCVSSQVLIRLLLITYIFFCFMSDSAGQTLAAPLVNLPSRKRCVNVPTRNLPGPFIVFSVFQITLLMCYLDYRPHRVTALSRVTYFIRDSLCCDPSTVLTVIQTATPFWNNNIELFFFHSFGLPSGTASIMRRCLTLWTWALLRSKSSRATTRQWKHLTQICWRCSAMQRYVGVPKRNEPY